MSYIIYLNNDPLKRYFNSINNKLSLKDIYTIAITGSCGKTSTSLYIYYFLKKKRKNVCYIGTHKIYYNELSIDTDNTTLEANVLINIFIKYNIKPSIIVMEVSSHGINLARINIFNFNIIVLTNLGTDHLDFHLNINNYHNVKLAFLNSSIYTNKVFIPSNYKNKYNFTNPKIEFVNYDKKFFNKLNSISFNKENMYLAYKVLSYLKYKKKEIISYLNNIKLNNGRMEVIHHNNRKIVIDYAHHIESFKAILDNNNYEKVVVFGCGGNRDTLKRSVMGEIASFYCKHVIITSDNNRNEEFDNIIKDISKNIYNYKVIKDRKEAIIYCLNNYPDLDIYILGKGDEQYLIEKDKLIKHNDKEFVLKYINNNL